MASQFQDAMFRNLTCKRIQVDEMWGFIGAKQKNVTPTLAAKNPNAGDIWLWVAIDADTKIVPTWMLGNRDAEVACQFLYDLRQRLSNRVQLTSDSHKAYLVGVDYAWSGMNLDYAMLVKLYGAERPGEARYSPAECIRCKAKAVIGKSNPQHISTSLAERQNLNVRIGVRRYIRLTNAFSRKIENHSAAVALYYFAYNFVNVRRTLRMSPAMAAGVTDRFWEVPDLMEMIEANERRLERAA